MPLRTTIFLHRFLELAQRAGKLQLESSDDALVQNLRSKGILTEDTKWAYLTWEAQQDTLECIAHLGQQPSVIQNFSTLRTKRTS